MTDISGAMEAARRLLAQEWQTRDDRYNAPSSLKDGCTVARALLSSHPQRYGEGNRGSEPQVPAPRPSAAEPSLDWSKILQRYGAIHERISTYADEDESFALATLCQMRDGLLGAARSGIPSQILAALEATNIIPGRAPIDPWQPISTAPKDGKVIVGMFTCSLKFKLYAKESAEYKRGIAGRWQIPRGEHGGWQNLHDWIPVAWSRADANQQSKTGGGEEK